MYDFCWVDIRNVLEENAVRVEYDGTKIINLVSEDSDNELSFTLLDGKVASLFFHNERVNLEYSVADNSVSLNFSYGNRSATVITEI